MGRFSDRLGVLRYRDYRWYLVATGFAQFGTRSAYVAMLYHVYLLTSSTFQVGLVAAVQGVAVLAFNPVAGNLADRLDRKLLLQLGQVAAAIPLLGLAALTVLDLVQAWHIMLVAAALVLSVSIERPVRQALIPAILPSDEVVRGVALLVPIREVSRIAGPALAGLVIAVAGPGEVYAIAGVCYVAIVGVVAIVKVRPTVFETPTSVWGGIRIAVGFMRRRRLLPLLMALDLSAMVFATYNILLPAISTDLLEVDAAGYGVLAAAPSIGALLGGVVAYLVASRGARAGLFIIGATICYGLSAVGLANSRLFVLALIAAVGLGLFDAIATTLRHAAVLLETPDGLRGRVSALYGIAAQGGPAVGELQMGAWSTLIGIPLALSIGGLVPVAAGVAALIASPRLRQYRAVEADPDPGADGPAAPSNAPPGGSGPRRRSPNKL